MKTNLHHTFKIMISLIIIPCAIFSCSKAPLNEADGSYFFYENGRVVFEDEGFIVKDDKGNLSIACYNGPKVIHEKRDCINILVPRKNYTISNNRLSFSISFDAKIRFFTESIEPHGTGIVCVHLQQNSRVHISGTITNDYGNDFFQTGNAYPYSISLSFSLEDGTPIRLKMETVSVSDDFTLIDGWL